MSPASYSNVHHRMWGDEAFVALSPRAKLVFQWSFSNGPGASLTGLTEASWRKIRNGCLESSDDIRVVEAVLAELAAKPLCDYDWDYEVLWCINRAGYAMRSAAQIKGGARWIANMPRCPILTRFHALYPQVIVVAS